MCLSRAMASPPAPGAPADDSASTRRDLQRGADEAQTSQVGLACPHTSALTLPHVRASPPRERGLAHPPLGEPVELRPREFALLVHLARDPARVHAKHDLLRAVWDFRAPGATRTLDSHASRLRRKLASAGAKGWVCATYGVGYRLSPTTQTAIGAAGP